MRYYHVLIPPGGTGREAVLVKEGFSWPALFFAPLWLAAKRMWRQMAVFAAWLFVAGLLTAWGFERAGGALAILPFVLLGFEGNGLHAGVLQRRGWEEAGLVAGANLDEAELRLARAAAGEL